MIMIVVGVDIGTHNKLLEGPCNLNVMNLVFSLFFCEFFENFPKIILLRGQNAFEILQ
jgi:hypothetical protein